MHPSDETLQALAHGELPLARQSEVRRHLAECPACERLLVDWKETEAYAARLLRTLDHPAPTVSVDALIARAAPRVRTRRHAAVAAGIAALVVAGVAAAAVPGSPVRQYVERVMGTPSIARSPHAPMTRRTPIRAAQPEASGIAFVPANSVEVTFRDSQLAGVLRITVADSIAVRIAQRGGSAGYALTDAGVSVENTGSIASYDLVLPRTLPHATVRVGQRIVFTTTHEHITTAAARDSSGSYVIRFTDVDKRRAP
ncbi:MAG: zf-HC2 domain-containing protein [Gemmatimonadota bacterium]|nr:zf-HC2 domain-containing protein [Gemmatimonadota bacterium]